MAVQVPDRLSDARVWLAIYLQAIAAGDLAGPAITKAGLGVKEFKTLFPRLCDLSVDGLAETLVARGSVKTGP